MISDPDGIYIALPTCLWAAKEVKQEFIST